MGRFLCQLAIVQSLWFLLTNSQSPPTRKWHGYDPKLVEVFASRDDCKIFENSTRPEIHRNDGSNKYGFWPGLSSPEETMNGETLFGLREATEIIRRNQNPENCATAEYIIIKGYFSGFGSTIHVEASILSLAIKTKRVLLRVPDHSVHQWMVDNQHCRDQGKTGLDCYYLPISRCTIKDALISNGGKKLEVDQVHSVFVVGMDNLGHMETHVRNSMNGHRAIVLHDSQKFGKASFIVPDDFRSILMCLPMQKKDRYYWWRAVSATFFLRPNGPTLKWLSEHRTLPVKETYKYDGKVTALTTQNSNNGKSIAVYVRHGDKASEMNLVPFTKYAQAIDVLMDQFLKEGSGNDTKSRPSIFIGTEDVGVLKEADEWGKQKHHQILHTDVIDRDSLTAAHKGTEKNHPEEYLSMLLNLEYSLKCDAYVGTLASNWCRVVDELRATVGNGANRPYIDLSKETCGKDMCINGGISNFCWRK